MPPILPAGARRNMLVTIKSFGSLWSRRIGHDPDHPKRFARATYYNTTGIRVSDQLRRRWKVGGDLRFYGTGCGFNPNHPGRAVNQTFECYDLEVWQAHNRVAVKRLMKISTKPDYYLIVTTSEQTGGTVTSDHQWKAADVVLVSFSEWKDHQELMLLMPPCSWIRGKLGTFFVEPSMNISLNGELRLDHY
jgi:hypothetical protein